MTSEMTLYDYSGRPVAYIVSGDGSIFTWDGRLRAYVVGDTIYGWNGKHLGWFVDGKVRQLNGRAIGFDGRRCSAATHATPAKSAKHAKPAKSARSAFRAQPAFSAGYSRESLEDFLEQGYA